MDVTAYDIAARYIGTKEVRGQDNNPLIVHMLKLYNSWPENDETPWCAAFVNFVCHTLDIPHTGTLRARHYLKIGRFVELHEARKGFDLVVMKRGRNQPGPENTEAPGHVGFFSNRIGDKIEVLGANQKDMVCKQLYPVSDVLKIVRIYEDV